MKKRYIMGLGNYSMYDDSIGIRVIEYISENNLDDNFEAIDLSSNTLNIFSYLNENTEKILIVDTATVNKDPGEFIFFTPKEVESQKQLSGITTHEGDMLKVLELGRMTGYYIPPITFMGIQPKNIKAEFGLSDILQKKISEYAQAAIDHIS